MHGSAVARDLAMRQVMIPQTPGILCALGLLVSALRHDLFETHVAHLDRAAFEGARGVIERMLEAAAGLLERDGIARDRRKLAIRADIRYVGQSYELPIPLASATLAAWASLPTLFHQAHEKRFGHCDPRAELEMVGIAVTGLGQIEPPRLPTLASGSADASHARIGERAVYFEPADPRAAGRAHQTAVYERARLLANNVIAGPAVIEELSATTVLYPGDIARVDASGCLLVEVVQ